MGDVLGKPTYFGTHCIAPITIDYSLCHEDMLDQIITFKVADFTPFSNHCQIATKIKTGLWAPENMEKTYHSMLYQTDLYGITLKSKSLSPC